MFRAVADSIIKRYETQKLKTCLRYAYRTSPFYHRLFKEHHLKPGDIRSVDDMTKIPPTDTVELQQNPRAFFCVPEDHFSKVFTTAGTTGKPKKAYFTKEDIQRIVVSTAMGFRLMYGITHQDVVRLSFEVGYGTEIWGNRYCLDKAYEIVGCLTLATGRLKIKQELEILRDYKPTIFSDVSSRINYLTKELRKITDLPALGVQKFLVGAEPTPQSMRKSIEDAWDADVFIGYGTTEIGLLMAGECTCKHGMHLSETNFLTEVVDPKTGEHVNDGDLGELLFTTYDREGMPLIRYNSHDLGRIIPGKCSCGLPFKRIEIKGRSDDLIPIGAGDNLFTRMFDETLFAIPEVEEYQIIFDRKNGKDVITVVAEVAKHTEEITKKIISAILDMPEIHNGFYHSKTVAKPKVELVKPNTFDRNSIKTRRLVDHRHLYD